MSVLFEMFRGDDYRLKLEITDDAGNAVDISGWTFKATMKLQTEMADSAADVQVIEGPVSGADAVAGIVRILLPRAQTVNLRPVDYFFDVQRNDGTYVVTLFTGRVRVKPDVTRSE